MDEEVSRELAEAGTDVWATAAVVRDGVQIGAYLSPKLGAASVKRLSVADIEFVLVAMVHACLPYFSASSHLERI